MSHLIDVPSHTSTVVDTANTTSATYKVLLEIIQELALLVNRRETLDLRLTTTLGILLNPMYHDDVNFSRLASYLLEIIKKLDLLANRRETLGLRLATTISGYSLMMQSIFSTMHDDATNEVLLEIIQEKGCLEIIQELALLVNRRETLDLRLATTLGILFNQPISHDATNEVLLEISSRLILLVNHRETLDLRLDTTISGYSLMMQSILSTMHDDATNEVRYGGSIANINADGTFTHVVVEEEEEEEDDKNLDDEVVAFFKDSTSAGKVYGAGIFFDDEHKEEEEKEVE